MGFSFSRLAAVGQRFGKIERSAVYDRVNKGLLTRPVDLNGTSNRHPGAPKAWPDHELDAICDAIFRGATEDEIRKLVAELESQRRHIAEGGAR